MSVLRNMAIKHKLISIIMATCIAALLLAGVAFIVWEWVAFRQQMVRNLSAHAEIIAENCKAALAFNDAKDGKETLGSLHVESSIVFGCIYDKEGKLFATYYRDYAQTEVHPTEIRESGYIFEGGLLTLFKSIVLDGETIGTVCVRSDLHPMYSMLRRDISIIAGFVLAACLMAYFMSSRLQRIISGPILSLAEVAKDVSEKKDYSTRAVKQTNDEIGSFIDAFNEMLEQIQQRDSALVGAKEQLEIRVKERTAELATANSQLQGEIEQREQAQEELKERIKETTCLYELSRLLERPKISLAQIFHETTNLVRNAYRHPEFTCVRIVFEGIQYKTDNFEKTELSQHAQIKVHGEKAGTIEVYCVGERIESSKKAFSEEGSALLNAVAEHLGRIAERSRAREKLQLFRNLINRSNDCIFVIEPQWGRFLDVNNKACNILGYKREELLDMTLKDIDEFISDDTSLQEYIRELERKGDVIREGLFRCKDGTTFFVEASLKHVSQEGKEYIVAVCRDITARKQAEEALRDSQQRLSNILYSILTGVVVVDAQDHKIIDANPLAMELIGLPKEEIIGKVCHKFICPAEEGKCPISDLGQKVDKSERVLLRADGSEIPILKTVTPTVWRGHEYLIESFVDITERKEAEQRQVTLLRQLERVNRELKDFAYIISHDLKAPLRGIKTLVDWISSDYADKLDEDGREQIGLLVNRVERMHNLIDGVLTYSKVGRAKEKKVWVDLNELVPAIIDAIVPPENIEITIEDKLPVVECGQTQITQVFQNLLSNAVKYMDKPKGRIRIDCVEDDGFWKFSVADNGPGIEEEHFKRIFRIFQTLSPRDEFESTGVGLTVVKKIVELYDGKIWLESKLGEGSTFFFTLPKQEKGVKNEELEAHIAGRR